MQKPRGYVWRSCMSHAHTSAETRTLLIKESCINRANVHVRRTMSTFKKELLVKTDQKIGGKDAKKLLQDVTARLASPEAATNLIGGKNGKDLSLRRTAGGLVCRIIAADGGPILFEVNSSGLLPTLPAMWREPSALPALHVHPQVMAYLLNGADLLLPGVHGVDESA